MILKFILFTLLIIILIDVLSKLYKFYVFCKTINKIPGDASYFSNVINFNRLSKDEYHKAFCQYTVRYKEGIYKLWMGYKPMVYIYKPEYAEVILRSSANIKKPTTYDSLQPCLGDGLITSSGSKWHHDRKLITPTFHFSVLDNYMIVMLEKSEILIDRIEKELGKNIGKNAVNIYPLIAAFTLDVICETAMGVNIHAQYNTFTGYSGYIHKMTNSIFYRYLRPWLKLNSIFALTAEGKQFYSSIKEIHRFNREVIKKKKEARREKCQDESEFDELGRKKRKSFIDILLDINENHSNQFSEKDMNEHVATIMLAGHDASSTAIFWTLLCLATEPEIQDKVYEELKVVFDDLDGPITMNTISQLKYLDRVCKETLRLYPVIPEFSRQITEEITIEYHKVFCEYTVRYKEGIYKLWKGYEAVVYIYKPEYVEVILRNSTNISKATTYDSFKPWLGDGLITSTGSKWHHDRKLINPAFHFSILDNYMLVMLEKSEILIDRIEKELGQNIGKNAVNIYPLLIDFALDVICETAMGVNIHAQDNTITGYPDYVQKAGNAIFYRNFRPWLKLDSIFALTAEGKQFYSSIKKIHRFNRDVIKKKKEARRQKCQDESEFDELGRKKRKSFIDILLDINESHSNQFSEEDMVEQVATIMFAGHDTSASAIFWTLLCLATEPEIQHKVYEELKVVFDDLDGPITMNTISQLKYLDRVCKETLRLYTVVPLFSRQITEEITIGQYVIPKNTELTIHVHGLHHDPEIWPDPEKFDPDRFLTNETQNRHPYSYIPFSAGPRNCIGQKFANLEHKLVIAILLKKWMVKSSILRKDIRMYHSVVLRPFGDVYLRFIPRE
ncbi:cytochrome P450 4C1-like [Vespa mandarinia]|uniref:cytochrome P450 4C1-like n=1 Tax=Vespa mandarinia TaxID=7446 RepID=UPI001613873E|nr:cytochrome P450 4C1-like [Vespa mandarinia]